MYPNFPKQVMEATDARLYFNLLIHYLTGLLPVYEVESRPKLDDDEEHPLTTISIVHINHLKQYFFTILSSQSSIPPLLVKFVDTAVDLKWNLQYSGEIPFKQTLCMIAAKQAQRGESITNVIKTSTDILRVMAYLCEQDIELKKKVKFRSLKRKTRRIIIEALEKVISEDDVKPYCGLWKLAFHTLHVGEYGGKLAIIAQRYRNERNVATSETIVCEAIKTGSMRLAVDQLISKPSVFARNLDKLLRDADDVEYVILRFESVIDRVGSKVLLQLLGHFKGRSSHQWQKRLVFTLGSKGKVRLAEPLIYLSEDIVYRVTDIIRATLKTMYAERGLLKGKRVHIQPAVREILLPLQMGSASETKRSVARGSRIPLDLEDKNKKFLRMFIHWIGWDQDLSATFWDGSFTKMEHVSYQNLRTLYAWHSGDITRAPAPEGASEFIDIDIEQVKQAGFRYVLMDVRSFTAEKFVDHSLSVAGYMMRRTQGKGEIFEPSTVRSKFDLVAETTSVISCAFDLKERCMIWIDAPLDVSRGLNNVETNEEGVRETLKAFISINESKVTIPELLELHSAELVEKDADFVVGLGDGDLDVFDFTKINAEWI